MVAKCELFCKEVIILVDKHYIYWLFIDGIKKIINIYHKFILYVYFITQKFLNFVTFFDICCVSLDRVVMFSIQTFCFYLLKEKGYF